MVSFDAVVVGAGASGLFCASVAGQLGLKILLLDHSPKVAEKIRISGGGRCNFTNRHTTARHFLSQNPHFCRSALARYTPSDFVALLHKHHIAFHEKHQGQLFCDHSAEAIIQMLLAECASAKVTHWQPCHIKALRVTHQHATPMYVLETDRGPVQTRAVVVASGGLSIPQIGASDWGYRVAQQFGLPIIQPRAALVPLTFDALSWAPFAQLSGLSLPVQVETGDKKTNIRFAEDMLFTHRGLSGPAILQISSYWQNHAPIRFDLAPADDLAQFLLQAQSGSRKRIANELSTKIPARLAHTWVAQGPSWGHDWSRPINETARAALQALAKHLNSWEITPSGTEGYKKAEVTAGGVDTQALSSQTMESRQAGLYFIGEVVDVTGWLGGYNFQWAWASAYACAQGLAAKLKTPANA